MNTPKTPSVVLITGGAIGIGRACAQAFATAGWHVVITDVNDYRLALAKKMGATRAVNVANSSLADVMKELGMVEGFDVGMEMSGVPSAFQSLLAAMNHGGKVALLSVGEQIDTRSAAGRLVLNVLGSVSPSTGTR